MQLIFLYFQSLGRCPTIGQTQEIEVFLWGKPLNSVMFYSFGHPFKPESIFLNNGDLLYSSQHSGHFPPQLRVSCTLAASSFRAEQWHRLLRHHDVTPSSYPAFFTEGFHP